MKQDGQPNPTFYYVHPDHLGSLAIITDANGGIQQKCTYDAWGKRTLVQGSLIFDRGFTGHEHLEEFALVNMNGRMYDPTLGRFLSPDPYVQNPLFSQSFNRYAYGFNNPLIYTDPDGEFFWIAVAIGFVSNYVMHGVNTKDWGWKAVRSGLVGAATAAVSFGAGYMASAGLGAIGVGGMGATVLGGAVGGAVSGGFSAAINGGNMGQGMLIGGIGGMLGGMLSVGNMDMKFFEKFAVSTFTGAWSGGFVAGITGGDMLAGMRNGAIGAAIGFAANETYKYVQTKNAEMQAMQTEY